jgi:hypothetical protein
MTDKHLIDDAMVRVHALEADHGPDDWPAIQMRDLVILRNAIMELRAELHAQRVGPITEAQGLAFMQMRQNKYAKAGQP